MKTYAARVVTVITFLTSSSQKLSRFAAILSAAVDEAVSWLEAILLVTTVMLYTT